MRTAATAVVDAGVDAWASERLGAARAERLRHLAADPACPPFFGRTDTRRRDVPHRPPARPRRRRRPRRHRLAGADEPAVLPGQRRRAAGSAAPPPVRVRRRRAHRIRGRAARPPATTHASRFLREEIERPRSGPMRDIVATIQPDQDDIVRAPLAESICVQGAPGTGKTAVGLHRAAYLLYTHGGQLAPVRRPGGRPQPGVPALHRGGPAHPRRGRGRPDDGGRPDRAGAGPCRWTRPRSPSSRATPGWPRCCAARCGARSPSRPTRSRCRWPGGSTG